MAKSKKEKTDYEFYLGSEKYQGQTQLMFDRKGQSTDIQGHAKYILTWSDCGKSRKGRKYCYADTSNNNEYY